MNYLFRRRRIEREMDEEFQSHLAMRTADLERQGVATPEAERQARIEFGGYQNYKEECRETMGTRLLQELWQDLRYGLRQLRRNPGFTTVAVLTLALGIGANTAIFSVADAVVLHPLPYSDSGRLVWIAEMDPDFNLPLVIAPVYTAWEKHAQALDRIAICSPFVSFNLTGRGLPERIQGAYVSASFFATLNVGPSLGRGFTAEEDHPHGPKAAVLTHSFWQQYFGSDRRVLGQTVTLDGKPYNVVGVMPASFRFPGDPKVQMLLPAALQEADSTGHWDSRKMLGVIGRLKAGASLAVASDELNTLLKNNERPYERGTELTVVPLARFLAGNLRLVTLVLLGVVGLVLLIACANVAHLTLARASARTREMALRAALGAGRWRLVRQLLVESVTLAMAGGAAGLLLANWGIKILTRLIPLTFGAGILSMTQPHIDGRVLLFVFGVSIVTGALFGLAPAISATRSDFVEGLKESPQRPNFGGSRGWLRESLCITEVSLALVLLIGAGLLMESFQRLVAVNPGFTPEDVVTMKISLPTSRYRTAQQRGEFFSEILRHVESLPGVRSAGLSDSLPLTPYATFMAPTHLLPRGTESHLRMIQIRANTVSPGYFYTLGIPVLKGRTFTNHDNAQSESVIVVNEALARRLWPGDNPVGKSFKPFFSLFTVVGVVGNVRHQGLGRKVDYEIYTPYLQGNATFMQLAVRTAGEEAGIASAIGKQVRSVDPDQPIYDVSSLKHRLSESLAPRRFNMELLGIFAFIALALAVVGIYGVMAFSVTRRTHEIGIRMALGAEKRDVLKMVIGQGLKLALVGVAIGIAGALALTRFLSTLLYGVKPTDPLTFIAVSLILIAVALLACYIPARRAAKVDPMVALRYE